MTYCTTCRPPHPLRNQHNMPPMEKENHLPNLPRSGHVGFEKDDQLSFSYHPKQLHSYYVCNRMYIYILFYIQQLVILQLVTYPLCPLRSFHCMAKFSIDPLVLVRSPRFWWDGFGKRSFIFLRDFTNSTKRGRSFQWAGNTVDGRNPAPLGMYETLQIMGYLPYQLVQDIFHQHYDWDPSTKTTVGSLLVCNNLMS